MSHVKIGYKIVIEMQSPVVSGVYFYKLPQKLLAYGSVSVNNKL